MPEQMDYSLRKVEEENIDLIFKWRNSDNIKNMMYSSHEITYEEHVRWFENLAFDESQLVQIFYHNNRPLGLVNFQNINSINGTCYWGIYIGEKDALQGSGSILGYLSLEYIFNTFGIRKVCAEILDFNSRSVKFHKKLGFTEEGRYKEHVFKDKRYVDVISMALFNQKWEEIGNGIKNQCFGSDINE
jgi:UDP-4-amino-4,6-dideoxy-N-acetyl-beta-L-altrosamine N-acetyltransferase